MTTETQRIKDLDYGNNTNQIVPLISPTGFSKKARKRLQVKVAIKSSGMLFVVWSFVCCGFVCCRARFLMPRCLLVAFCLFVLCWRFGWQGWRWFPQLALVASS
ncbi:unnamed protein product [Polarella glacialis]|uniref:Uncharacterized protein n=1 Tax=Polarella glacialis TaxID=89957 RepID=A0A813K494_POLGL|nr:unnamed protein product [Polarella glacialis]